MSKAELDVEALFATARAGATAAPKNKIAQLGSSKKQQPPKVTWEQVVDILNKELDAKKEDLEVLKSSLVFGGAASKAAFNRLNDHMGPIKKEGTAKPGDWTFSSLAELHRKEYFHGYLASDGAQSKLSNLPDYSWLLRFSVRQAKSFALSMLLEGDHVDHWLVVYDEDTNTYGIADQEQTFPTVYDVVAYYRSHPLPDSEHHLEFMAFSLEGKLTIGRKLGGGNFGSVFEATWIRETGEMKVAAKSLNVDPATASKTQQQYQEDELEVKPVALAPEIEAEANILKRMNHNNVVRFFGMVLINEVQFIVTELMNDGSLLDYLKKVRTKENTTPLDLVRMAKDTALGMHYLTQQNVVHRDLAARNLLVNVGSDGVPVVKVTDFGLSRKIGSGAYYIKSGNTGDPVCWAAPESFKPQPGKDTVFKGRVSTRSDRWSFGVVLHEIFHLGRSVPYDGIEKAELRGYMMEHKPMIDFLKVVDAPVAINELMRDLLNYDSHARPDFGVCAERLTAIEKELVEKPDLNTWQHADLPPQEEAQGNADYDEGDPDDDGEEITLAGEQ